MSDEGETEIITVEELSGNVRVEAGTYKVTYKAANWHAGFTVKISGNQISSAYSPFYSVYNGKISAGILKKDSGTKATYSFVHKLLGLNFNTGVVAEISNSELKVSKK